jgi:hypothetical protein
LAPFLSPSFVARSELRSHVHGVDYQQITVVEEHHLDFEGSSTVVIAEAHVHIRLIWPDLSHDSDRLVDHLHGPRPADPVLSG